MTVTTSRRFFAAGAVGWLGAAGGCGGFGWDVERHPHPSFAPAEAVDYPPPPAHVEHVRESPPAPDCRWVDGQWLWTARRWQWQTGRWVIVDPGCQYAEPTFNWTAGGESDQARDVLYYRPGRWYSVTEPRICPPMPPCPGTEGDNPALPTTPDP